MNHIYTEETTQTETNSGLHPPNPVIPGQHYSPLAQAGAAIVHCLGTPSGQADIEALADTFESILRYEQIEDLADNAVILAGHARVLDAVFTRCLMGCFPENSQPNLNVLCTALVAQRQCGQTIGQLRRTGPRQRQRQRQRNERIFDERSKGQ